MTDATRQDVLEASELPLIRVQGVSKSFFKGGNLLRTESRQEVRALRDVSFELAPGEIMVLRGANGSGKSTLLRILARLVTPDTGHLQTAGAAPVGFSSGEERSLYWRLTPAQNLAFAGALGGLDREATQADGSRLLAEMGLSSVINIPVRSLSSGQRQRLLVARALIARPQLILLDEPTAHMDAEGASLLWEVVQGRVGDGACAVISTHRTEDGNQATVLARLDGGRLTSVVDHPHAPGAGEPWTEASPSRVPPRSKALRRALGFIRRDVAIARSYPLGLALQILTPLMASTTMFFLSRAVGRGSSFLHAYSGRYFAFAVLGEAAFLLQLTVLMAFSTSIRESQVTGTLEAMLASGIRLPAVLANSSLWSLTLACFQIAVLMLVSLFLFGMQLSPVFLIPGVLAFVLMPLSCIGIGFGEAAFILIIKRGSPLNTFLSIGTQLFGGILYPISVIPAGLRIISALLPVAHGADALRFAFLTENGTGLAHALAALVLLGAVYGALGYAAVLWSVRVTKRTGTLGQY